MKINNYMGKELKNISKNIFGFYVWSLIILVITIFVWYMVINMFFNTDEGIISNILSIIIAILFTFTLVDDIILSILFERIYYCDKYFEYINTHNKKTIIYYTDIQSFEFKNIRYLQINDLILTTFNNETFNISINKFNIWPLFYIIKKEIKMNKNKCI